MTVDLRRLLPPDGQRHRYLTVQHFRCQHCGAYYLPQKRDPRIRPPGRTAHLPSCPGVWWVLDGEPRYYIDEREVSRDEWYERCPVPPVEVG